MACLDRNTGRTSTTRKPCAGGDQISDQSRKRVFANVSTNFRHPFGATFFNAYYGNSIYFSRRHKAEAENIDVRRIESLQRPLNTATARCSNFLFHQPAGGDAGRGNLISESVNAGNQSTYGLT